MEELMQYTLDASKYIMIIMSVLILFRCIRSMLSERIEPEVWAYIKLDDDIIPVFHWENLIGRSRSSDVRIKRRGVSKFTLFSPETTEISGNCIMSFPQTMFGLTARKPMKKV